MTKKTIMASAALAMAMAASMSEGSPYFQGYGRQRTWDKPEKGDKCKDCIKFGRGCKCSNANLPPCSGFRKCL